MSLLAAIRDLWISDHSLVLLVPGERLFSGLAYGEPVRPYVVVHRLGGRPVMRTTGAMPVEETALRFRVWADSLEAAGRVAAAIDARYDRRAFEIGDVRCLQMRRTHDSATVEVDGLWRILVDYLVLHQRITGD